MVVQGILNIDNSGEKNLCLCLDLNLKSTVLRTGILSIRPQTHIQTQKQTSLSFVFQSKALMNVIGLLYSTLRACLWL